MASFVIFYFTEVLFCIFHWDKGRFVWYKKKTTATSSKDTKRRGVFFKGICDPYQSYPSLPIFFSSSFIFPPFAIFYLTELIFCSLLWGEGSFCMYDAMKTKDDRELIVGMCNRTLNYEAFLYSQDIPFCETRLNLNDRARLRTKRTGISLSWLPRWAYCNFGLKLSHQRAQSSL